MGHVRLSRVMRARVGYFVGALIVAAGVCVIAGLGWALVALGVAVVVAFVWLYDVDEPEPVALESQLRRRPVGDDW